jgi:hypothetical protein
MMQAYQDAMAIVRNKGIPDVFFTLICNPNWQEIIAERELNQIAFDRPDFGRLCISNEGESPS